MKYYIVIGLFVFVNNFVSGQHTVNPGRPSFSENNHLVPTAGLQAENGFSSTENYDHITYSYNTLLRFGLQTRWEGRIFSGLETFDAKDESTSEWKSCGLGAGLKFQVLKENGGLPSIGLLAQSLFPQTGYASHMMSALVVKEFHALAIDFNVNANFKGDKFDAFAYIVCAGYSMGKTTIFAEGMFNKNAHSVDELWLQIGGSFLFSPKWQIDIAAASYGSQFSNQMFQLGFSFLILTKSVKINHLNNIRDRQ